MISSCCHSVNSEMFLDSVTLISCAGFAVTLLDQLRELFNPFIPFIVRLSTVKLSVYQSISCLHFTIVVRTNIDQLCISISSVGRTDLHQLCVCVIRPVVNIIPSVVCTIMDQLCVSQSVVNII